MHNLDILFWTDFINILFTLLLVKCSMFKPFIFLEKTPWSFQVSSTAMCWTSFRSTYTHHLQSTYKVESKWPTTATHQCHSASHCHRFVTTLLGREWTVLPCDGACRALLHCANMQDAFNKTAFWLCQQHNLWTQESTALLQQATDLCLTTDIWSNRDITGHFMLNFSMKLVTLACQRMTG